jgi:hypothetical protein
MYVITKHFCSRSLACSKTVHFPLLHAPNNVRDQIALKIKISPVCSVVTGNFQPLSSQNTVYWSLEGTGEWFDMPFGGLCMFAW